MNERNKKCINEWKINKWMCYKEKNELKNKECMKSEWII